MMEDHNKLQKCFDDALVDSDFVCDMAHDLKVKDYSMNAKTHRLSFLMADGSQRHIDTTLHKTKEEDKVEFSDDDSEDDKDSIDSDSVEQLPAENKRELPPADDETDTRPNKRVKTECCGGKRCDECHTGEYEYCDGGAECYWSAAENAS